MFISNTEILLLRPCAWCKDLPAESSFLPKEETACLFLSGLIRKSRNGLSLRVTDTGFELLNRIGFEYERDIQFRGAGHLIDKRLQTAELLLFLFQGKTDVFCSAVPDRNNPPSFMPSFTLRREKNKNPLGTARFNGILYTKDTAAALYYISEHNDGLYPETERNTFTMNILTGGRKSAAAFTGAGELEEILRVMRQKSTRSNALPVLDAARRLDCPVCFFPLSVNGARQMRIISVNDWRKEIAQHILKSKYSPPSHKWYDAEEKILVGIDMDIPRMETAAEYGVHIILLDWQAEAAKEILRGRKAVLHPISTKTAEEILKLPPELYLKTSEPYITEKGEYLSAPVKDCRKG